MTCYTATAPSPSSSSTASRSVSPTTHHHHHHTLTSLHHTHTPRPLTEAPCGVSASTCCGVTWSFADIVSPALASVGLVALFTRSISAISVVLRARTCESTLTRRPEPRSLSRMSGRCCTSPPALHHCRRVDLRYVPARIHLTCHACLTGLTRASLDCVPPSPKLA